MEIGETEKRKKFMHRFPSVETKVRILELSEQRFYKPGLLLPLCSLVMLNLEHLNVFLSLSLKFEVSMLDASDLLENLAEPGQSLLVLTKPIWSDMSAVALERREDSWFFCHPVFIVASSAP